MSSATSSGAAESAQTFISIHAITRSATRVFTSLIHLNPKFQSTHSQGVRRINHTITTYTNAISIHALARSATQYCRETSRSVTISIHALARSATSASIFSAFVLAISIHALTRSATFCYGFFAFHKRNFNPRTHEECDQKQAIAQCILSQFQSTHSRGVRLNAIKDTFVNI